MGKGIIQDLDDWFNAGRITIDQLQQVQLALKANEAILIAGPSGSGRSTLFLSLLRELEKKDEPFSVVQDGAAPLWVSNPPHNLSIPATPMRSMKECIRDCVRMNFLLGSGSVRLMVDEIRDPDVASSVATLWLQGHPGGIGVIYGTTIREAIQRFEFLAMGTNYDLKKLVGHVLLVDKKGNVVEFGKNCFSVGST